ncbi:MAG: ATP-binding protein [Clostridia bacterium]|nr:ATP-binding protein [Clostridia bacterium]
MERKMMAQLIAWKDKPGRKPLLLTGVRQCGKTYLLKQFGKEYFEDFAYYNFEEDDTLSSVFDYDLKVERIIDELGNVIRGKEICPGKTLLVLDEMQVCPRAITSLKYFQENLPELHVIAAGSLLGVAIGKGGISFPVGKVNRLQMYPMSFEEFVIADGGERLIRGLRRAEINQPLSEAYTVPLTKYLKLYYIVGGMPAAVKQWTETHQMEPVMEIQDEIIKDYADDFAKHAPLSDLPKLRLIWDSIPAQLARDNHKFIFSHVKSGARTRDLEDAMRWLVEAGLIHQLFLVEKPQIPLSDQADFSSFKVYLSDTGLLCRRMKISPRAILEENDQFVHTKGALTENYVYTQLISMGIPAWYWQSDANAEIDYLIEGDADTIPVEVKSADNTKAKSLRLFCKKYKTPQAIKTSMKNVGWSEIEETKVWSVPLYMLFDVERYVGNETAPDETEATPDA